MDWFDKLKKFTLEKRESAKMKKIFKSNKDVIEEEIKEIEIDNNFEVNNEWLSSSETITKEPEKNKDEVVRDAEEENSKISTLALPTLDDSAIKKYKELLSKYEKDIPNNFELYFDYDESILSEMFALPKKTIRIMIELKKIGNMVERFNADVSQLNKFINEDMESYDIFTKNG